jgi:transcriptional regulator with XRE-family HTH domain
MKHALRRFLEDGLERRGWSQATLARESGLSKQVINGIVGDERSRLDRLPQDKTIDGLARAFEVEREVVLTVIGEALGLPVSEPVVVYDASGVADSDLLRELARRLGAAGAAVPHGARTARAEDYAWAARPGRPDLSPDAGPVHGRPGAEPHEAADLGVERR